MKFFVQNCTDSRDISTSTELTELTTEASNMTSTDIATETTTLPTE